MGKTKKILFCTIIFILLLFQNVEAHNKIITGYKEKNSKEIIQNNEKYYGYHNKDEVRHYHQVEWDDENQKWKIINSAVCYDENFCIIDDFENNKTEKIKVKYYEKIDGDTAKFELNGKIIKVRFLGINTPETVDKTTGEELYGKEASNYTEERLKNGNKIEIEYDSKAPKQDKYERVLAWVWVDDSLLQKELVEKGFANTYMLQDNYKYTAELQFAKEEAKRSKVGISSGEIIANNKVDENDTKKEKLKVINDCIVIIIVVSILVFIVIVILKKINIFKEG